MSTFLADAAENLTVDGPSARFTYRRFGPRHAVPLVLLNRFRGTIDWWDPLFLDLLAAHHDVVVFDNVGVGYTTGEPHDSLDGLADGAIEFIDALGLGPIDLLGWTLGGAVAQNIAIKRPDLVRRLVVAASTPGGSIPDAPPPSERVRTIMGKPDVTDDELVYLFFPDTDAGRAAGAAHLARVAPRLAAGLPTVSDIAAKRQRAAIGKSLALPLEQALSNLHAIKQPVLYANGVQDALTPALASYLAVQHLDSATLVLYSDAGHAFLFQHAKAFAAQVITFLGD